VDPITHGLLGAAIAQAVTLTRASRAARAGRAGRAEPQAPTGRRLYAMAALTGAAAGMLPDIDLFFTPPDPALPWEAHRHFTHALAFATIGGLVALLPFLLFRRARARFRGLLVVAVLAYASHGLLDACTSYGTHLFLPFSAARVSWDLIAIIDPIFTGILAAGVALGFLFARRSSIASRPVMAALLLCAAYLGLGARQHAKALGAVERDAAGRGQTIEHARAMPAPGSLLVWRGLYLADGRIWAEGGRVPFFGAPRFRSGGSVEAFVPASVDVPAQEQRARLASVAVRFESFADGFAARDPDQPDVVADMRYSIGVADFEPLWGIRLNPNPSPGGEPVAWVELVTDRGAVLRRLLSDLKSD
jgi:inner membrane protein